MREHKKVYTGNFIVINRLAQLLEEQNISSIIKNHKESGRLAGFGTTGASSDLFIYKSDFEDAKKIIHSFNEEVNS